MSSRNVVLKAWQLMKLLSEVPCDAEVVVELPGDKNAVILDVFFDSAKSAFLVKCDSVNE